MIYGDSATKRSGRAWHGKVCELTARSWRTLPDCSRGAFAWSGNMGLHWFLGQWAKGQNPKGSPHYISNVWAFLAWIATSL